MVNEMKNIKINSQEYEIIENDQECLNIEEISEKLTDYFEPYDYIFGDYAYGKVRLKGFNDSNNKKAKKVNDIKTLDEYKEKYCSYGAKFFLLKKVPRTDK